MEKVGKIFGTNAAHSLPYMEHLVQTKMTRGITPKFFFAFGVRVGQNFHKTQIVCRKRDIFEHKIGHYFGYQIDNHRKTSANKHK